MKSRNLLFTSLAALCVLALPATTADALLVKVSIHFGPTVRGPDDGTPPIPSAPALALRIPPGFVRERPQPTPSLHR